MADLRRRLNCKTTRILLAVSMLIVFILISLPHAVSAATLTLQPNSTDGKDTYIVSGSQKNKNYGAAVDMDIRGNGNRNTLIGFNLSSILPSSRINSAVLKLYVTSTGAPPPAEVNLYRINSTSPWTEGTGSGSATDDGATWNTYNGTGSWANPDGGGDFDDSKIWANATIPSANKWYEWNITALVQNWINVAYPNFGMLLKTTTSSSGTTTFISSDNTTASRIWPVLIVDYCTPNWTADYTACNISDKRIKYYLDANSCGTSAGLPAGNGTVQSCNYCSYSVTNTSWTEWQNQDSCLINDTQKQNRSRTEYDVNYDSCYAVTNLPSDLWNSGNNNTNWEYRYVVCDYCTENITGPFNTSCVSSQLIQYYVDANYETCCAVTNSSSDCSINGVSYANQTLACASAEQTPPSSSGDGGGSGNSGWNSGLTYIRANKTNAGSSLIPALPVKTNVTTTQVIVENTEMPEESAIAGQSMLMQNIMGLSVLIEGEAVRGMGALLVGVLLVFLVLMLTGALIKNRELFYVPMLIVKFLKKPEIKLKFTRRYRV